MRHRDEGSAPALQLSASEDACCKGTTGALYGESSEHDATRRYDVWKDSAMFAIEKLDDVREVLGRVYFERVLSGVYPASQKFLRGPIGLFLIKDDGSAGSKLAEEVVKSYMYWDGRSGSAFDAIFLGWGYDGIPAYLGADAYLRCVNDVEGALHWQYHGGSHLFIVDFVYRGDFIGEIDFSKVISLNITELQKKQQLDQLGQLMEDIILPSKNLERELCDYPVDYLSDYVGLLRARKFFWTKFVQRLGFILGLADEVMPYAVHDLRRKPASV